MGPGVAPIKLPYQGCALCQTIKYPMTLSLCLLLQETYMLSIQCVLDGYGSRGEDTCCMSLRMAHAVHKKASAALEATLQLPIAPKDLLKAKTCLWTGVCPATIHGHTSSHSMAGHDNYRPVVPLTAHLGHCAYAVSGMHRLGAEDVEEPELVPHLNHRLSCCVFLQCL